MKTPASRRRKTAMKKSLSFLIVLSLLLFCVTAFAEAPAGTESDSVILDDFSVTTIDGSTFTLSEALKGHELVVINLWATWCPPCYDEFAFMQEAWSVNADRVALIALSVEPTDTEDAMRSYADELGLTFPIANVGNTGLDSFAANGIPTTIVLDHSGRIAAVELGAKTSVQAFQDLFDGYTGENYDPALCTYTVYAYDDNKMLSDLTVSFCSDTSCVPVTTNDEGVAEFKAPPARYHLQLVEAPDGHEDTLDSEIYTEPYSQTIILYLPNV